MKKPSKNWWLRTRNPCNQKFVGSQFSVRFYLSFLKFPLTGRPFPSPSKRMINGQITPREYSKVWVPNSFCVKDRVTWKDFLLHFTLLNSFVEQLIGFYNSLTLIFRHLILLHGTEKGMPWIVELRIHHSLPTQSWSASRKPAFKNHGSLTSGLFALSSRGFCSRVAERVGGRAWLGYFLCLVRRRVPLFCGWFKAFHLFVNTEGGDRWTDWTQVFCLACSSAPVGKLIESQLKPMRATGDHDMKTTISSPRCFVMAAEIPLQTAGSEQKKQHLEILQPTSFRTLPPVWNYLQEAAA